MQGLAYRNSETNRRNMEEERCLVKEYQNDKLKEVKMLRKEKARIKLELDGIRRELVILREEMSFLKSRQGQTRRTQESGYSLHRIVSEASAISSEIRTSNVNDTNVENRSGRYEELEAVPLPPAYRPTLREVNKRLDCVDQREDYDM